MSLDSIFTQRYQTVAEANRRNYAKVARYYVKNVACVVDPEEQRRLRGLIEQALEALGDVGHPPVTLDACGGAGNAALQMLEMGCRVTLVDISPEMIEIFRESCEQGSFPAAAEAGEIGEYLGRHRETFDLIVFSSAMHHLENPVGVLRLARSSLAAGGIIATIFDPIRQPLILRAMRMPIHWFKRFRSSPRLLLTRTIPVLKRLLSGGDAYKDQRKLEITEDNVGNLAEFHGGRGFDDHVLVGEIAARTGLRVLNHARYIGNCSRIETYLRKLLRRPNQFQLILQKAP